MSLDQQIRKWFDKYSVPLYEAKLFSIRIQDFEAPLPTEIRFSPFNYQTDVPPGVKWMLECLASWRTIFTTDLSETIIPANHPILKVPEDIAQVTLQRLFYAKTSTDEVETENSWKYHVDLVTEFEKHMPKFKAYMKRKKPLASHIVYPTIRCLAIKGLYKYFAYDN
jgi:hypothetical protein